MTRKRPHDPAKATQAALDRKRQDFEAVGLSPEAAELSQNADLEITRKAEKRDGKTVENNTARRLDAFSALKAGMAKGAYDGARQYEEQTLIRRGENDRGPSRERVDRTAGFTTDAMIDAAKWIEAINARLAPRDWWLLMELICPTKNLDGYCKEWVDAAGKEHSVGPFVGWRATVAFITGETDDHGQGAAVRAMTVNLRDIIEAHEKAQLAGSRKAA